MTTTAFHRPARIYPPALPDQKVTLPAPPQVAQNSSGSAWVSLLLPLLSSMSMAAYMITYGKPLLIFLGIAMVLISVGVTFGMRWQMRHASRKTRLRQRDRYLDYLDETKKAARQVATAQRGVAAWVYPSPERLWAIANNRRRVWERRPADADFLRVRAGQGRGPLATPLQMGARIDPNVEYDADAMAAAQRLADVLGTVGRQPAVIDLARAGVVSILGPPVPARALARALLCQVGVLHAPDDVTVAVCTGGGGEWEWVKWLPHTREPDDRGGPGGGPATKPGAGPGGGPLVAEEFEGLADFLERSLVHAQQERADRRGVLGANRNELPKRRLILFLPGYDPGSEWARGPLVTALLESAGPELGITVVCLVEKEGDEPTRVDVRARLDAEGGLVLEGRRPELYAAADRATADQPAHALSESIARALAPLRLSGDSEQILTRTVSLPEMLGLGDLARLDPETSWKPADDPDLLRLPLGRRDDGEPLVLDLKEAAQGGMGPHGLVVGATGSGKSELLRTLVTGLTATHSPELLSLVLVDFKGGATFAGVTELPHVAGLITNLADDLALVERVRAALHGEQQRRQRMLRDAGNVDSLRDYQLRQAAGHAGLDGKPLEPLPYLLVIVDEFGELLSRRPDFIDLFVQIGRVGRSLGMHLLLATQRLEEGRLRGLESHLSYRICLRTFSAAESRAVIGSTDAYRLPGIPGSAYLKVDESVYERFRVAHVSAPYQEPEAADQRPDAGPPILLRFGLRCPDDAEAAQDEPRPQLAALGPTQMQVAVERLCRFGRPVHQVWVPPLPAAIPLDWLLGPVSVHPERGLQAGSWPKCGELTLPVGVIDLPAEQRQLPLVIDFAKTHGSLALVGAPQSGKSTMLRTAMLAAMLTHTPEEVQFYCIDYGGGTLRALERAPHVGGVAGRHDEQRAQRVLTEVHQLIGERERLFRELGVDSIGGFRGLRRAGKLPEGIRAADIVLVIDNWGSVRTELAEAEEIVVEVAARGLGAGIHLVLTANRWADIRMNLRDAIGARMELRLNDPTESEVNRQVVGQVTAATPGRGAVPPGVLCQVALPRLDGLDSLDGLGDAQDETLDKIIASWRGPAAPPVRILPELVHVRELTPAGAAVGIPAGAPAGTVADPPAGVAIGLGEPDLAPVHLDLTGSDPHFLVFGDTGSGKSSFLRTWMRGLAASRTAWQARFMIVDYRRSLFDVAPEPHVGAYAGDAAAAREYAGRLVDKLAERMPPPGISARELRERSWWTGPDLYVVVDDYDLVAGGAQAPLAGLADYVPQAREIGFHLVLAQRTAGVSRVLMTDALTTRVRELGAGGLVLSGDPREGVLLGDQRASARAPGRGVLVRRQHSPTLVQVALGEDEV